MATRAPKTVEVDSIKHVSDTRKNIPTEELRDFVADDEHNPKKMLYPRNPDLDPQLVWKGKDEQDTTDLEVPVVPIYIQEKIHPHAIIDDIRRQAKQTVQSTGQASLDLFADFNGINFEQQIEFYQHNQKWQNRMILGDSLYVMTSLAEKEGLKGQIQMIYLDPPYGIKFGSNWQVSTRKRDVKDGKVEDVTRQPEQVKAFRDTWKLGIHSYLAYLRDRLVVARELLTESGSVFVQIGDENVHLVRCLLDEVFGSENFIAQIAFAKTSGYATNFLTGICDYILWYGKNRQLTKYRQLYIEKIAGEFGAAKYNRIMLSDGQTRTLLPEERSGDSPIPKGARFWVDDNLTSQGNPLNPFKYRSNNYSGTYKTTVMGLEKLAHANRLYAAEGTLRYIRFIDDFPVVAYNAAWMDIGGVQSRTDPKVYVVQTATEAIKRCLSMTTDPGDLVLDPTCGSGTTAYVAEQWGRRWITCDTSRVALALARTRLMAAKYPYYLLADSQDGVKKESEVTGKVPDTAKTTSDIKRGFVYKRVPHITLKSIANNIDIDVIHANYQAQFEPLRTKLNELLRQSWEEWEVPRQPNTDWNAETKATLAQWWELRQKRQAEIDAAIGRNADTETLFDQPYEDNKKIRVTGPFTVESLSPHRVLSTDIEQPQSEQAAAAETATGDFTTIILENLRKAGVQNTIKNERLKFDSLEPYAGHWLQAIGQYTESDSTGQPGAVKRVAISIGPEHGTVSPTQVKEAAKEAVQGVGFDLLLICGLSFDPHVSEEAKRYGKLLVLPVRVNPDLAMGGDLLKKTGSGNLFMIFGEPDLDIRKTKDGKVQVELKGLDIYDPTTGQIRNNSTKEIACWFIDTNYNGESFFVRHAYFTGGDEPYDKLKRALRAEIDEAAWSQLYSTVSRPFDPPDEGKIAVKVINHYGDEVLKVFVV